MNEQYIDIQEVRDNPHLNWDRFSLSANKQLTVKDVETLKLPNSKDNWYWDLISKYMNIQQVRENPNLCWDLYWLSRNKTVTVKDIDTLQLPNSKCGWDWYGITSNIDINEVINNPTKPWDKQGLKCNNGCTKKVLEFFDSGLIKHLQRKIGPFKYRTDIVIKCE